MSKLSITLDKEKNTVARPIVQSNDSLDQAPRNRAPEIAPVTAGVSISVSLCPCRQGCRCCRKNCGAPTLHLRFSKQKNGGFSRQKRRGGGDFQAAFLRGVPLIC